MTADAVKVGIAFPDLSALKDVVDLDNGDYQKAYQAVVDSINAKGGIAGRKIDPVFAPINPIGANARGSRLHEADPGREGLRGRRASS